MEKKEKKVEYIELIYDLIFVYIIGRNGTLLHDVSGSVVNPYSFLTYTLSTLIVLQIWYFTTLYVNRYGVNGPKLYVGIFVNMFLLYFMSQGIRSDWTNHYAEFGGAWALILINLACLYLSEYRVTDRFKVWERKQIRFTIIVLFCEAAIVVAMIPVYLFTGIPLGGIAMVFGMVMAGVGSKINSMIPVDFSHLTERVMLYVVFTFGEMVIAIAGYFEGGLNPTTIYFALCAFLIVIGLFTSYGMMYDKIIDRELTTGGTSYMMLHVFLIFALNNITAAMEFMREEKLNPMFKTLFLTVSFIVYFVFLFIIGSTFSKSSVKPDRLYVAESFGAMAIFAVLMVVFYDNGYASIAVTVLYVASVFLMILLHRKRKKCL